MNRNLKLSILLLLALCLAPVSADAQNLLEKSLRQLRQLTEEITSQFRGDDNTRQPSDPTAAEALEIPTAPAGLAEELIAHSGFTLSYNYRHRIPNWVAWNLTAEEVEGTVPRAGGFKTDPSVRGTQADDSDYRNSGWDRGHMAPAADMKWSRQSMLESFYLSNVCPQNQNLNRGDWKDLEELCRELAKRYGNVWIACGPIVGQAVHGRIGSSRVTVPDAFYKVLLIRHNGKYEGIGFLFKNEAGSRNLSFYARTIDQIEQLSGIDFFPQLPDPVEEQVESRKDLRPWHIR